MQRGEALMCEAIQHLQRNTSCGGGSAHRYSMGETVLQMRTPTQHGADDKVSTETPVGQAKPKSSVPAHPHHTVFAPVSAASAAEW
jgi:hypothetical protein